MTKFRTATGSSTSCLQLLNVMHASITVLHQIQLKTSGSLWFMGQSLGWCLLFSFFNGKGLCHHLDMRDIVTTGNRTVVYIISFLLVHAQLSSAECSCEAAQCRYDSDCTGHLPGVHVYECVGMEHGGVGVLLNVKSLWEEVEIGVWVYRACDFNT